MRNIAIQIEQQIEGLIAELENQLITAPEQNARADMAAYNAAVKKYEDEATASTGSIASRIQQTDTDIATAEHDLSNLIADLANFTEDNDTYYAIEEALDKATNELARLKRRRTALNNGSAKLQKGSDEALAAVRAAFARLSESESTQGTAAAQYREFMQAISEAAEKRREKKHISYTTTGLVDHHVKFYEKHHGPINVAGHTAGTDAEAKRRFVLGCVAGLEKTAAGQQLLKEEGEESHE